MTDRDPTKLTVDDWIAELGISEAEVELVPGEVVLTELEQQLAHMFDARSRSRRIDTSPTRGTIFEVTDNE